MLFGGPLLWATLSLLVVLSGRGRRPRLTQAPMLLHYASALALVAMTVGWFDVPAALMRAQELVLSGPRSICLGRWRCGGEWVRVMDFERTANRRVRLRD
jgi:hypothetical protein